MSSKHDALTYVRQSYSAIHSADNPQHVQMKDIPNSCDDDDVIRRFGVLSKRSESYLKWLSGQLQSQQCHRVLDAACGTGGDCIFLLKNGFNVVGADGADAMLNQARKARDLYQRQDENQRVANWEINKANWLSLREDLSRYREFDAVLCLGNSMINLIDPTPNLDLYRRSFENFKSMLKPGGVLLIDHRNMDSVIDHGVAVNKHVYFEEDTIHKMEAEIVSSPEGCNVVSMTYDMIVTDHTADQTTQSPQSDDTDSRIKIEKVTVPLQPIRVQKFASILQEVFGKNSKHTLYGDLIPVKATSEPAYYQHVMIKRDDQ